MSIVTTWTCWSCGHELPDGIGLDCPACAANLDGAIELRRAKDFIANYRPRLYPVAELRRELEALEV